MINETKSWFFEQINKILKLLTRLIKKKRELAQTNKIRNEKRKMKTDTKEIERIIRDCWEQLYANNNLEEMEKFLKTYNLPRLNHEETENLNRPITSKEIELVIKNFPKQKSRTDSFTGEFYQTLKKELTLILLKF